MYKYLRAMMDLADQIGQVDDIFMGDWGKNTGALFLNGEQPNGLKFKLHLEVEVKEDGDQVLAGDV